MNIRRRQLAVPSLQYVVRFFALLSIICAFVVIYYISVLFKHYALHAARKTNCEIPMSLSNEAPVLQELTLACDNAQLAIQFLKQEDHYYAGNFTRGEYNWNTLTCKYKELTKSHQFSHERNLQYGSRIDSEFIKISCYNVTFKSKDYFAFIQNKPLLRGIRYTTTSKNLNVMMIGISGMSRHIFEKLMPKSWTALKKDMQATIYKSFHVQSQFESENLLLLLTGNRQDCRRGSCDFIWKDFIRRGYVTAFGEDCNVDSIFNNDRFSKPPIDYYLGPLINATSKSNECPSCVGSRPSHDVLLSYALSFAENQNRWQNNYFGLFWLHGFTRSNLSFVHQGDESLSRFLNDLVRLKVNRNMALIIVGDGKAAGRPDQEDVKHRLPILAVYMPLWFRWMNDPTYKLVTNQFRLVNFRDVYDTMQFVSAPGEHPKPVGLFADLPVTRDCDAADIDKEMCVCLSKSLL